MSDSEHDELDMVNDASPDVSMVDAMVLQTAAEVGPDVVNKWIVHNPALAAKKKKGPQKKRKNDDSRQSTTAAGKSKKPKVIDLDDDEDEAEPPKKFTVHIFIPRLAVPVASSSRSRKSGPAPDPLEKGPFQLISTDSFETLLAKIAKTLPCRPENIHITKLRWKPKKPGNAKYLLLTKGIGYQTMLTEMGAKKPDARTIYVEMPAPAEPMEDAVPWPTEDADDEADVKFQNSKYPAQVIPSISRSFNKATKTQREVLEAKYPIGGDPLFPDKRVYLDKKTGYYFELNVSRLGVWCSAMADGRTDENSPPQSRFFDAGQRMKLPNASASLPAPALNPAPAAPAAAPALSITDLFLASVMSGGGLGAMFPHLNNNQAPPMVPLPNNHPRTAPPSPVKRHNILTDQFCELYDIDDVTCERLKDVGFRPGDYTEAKADEDLKEAGFNLFTWRRVHAANLRFKADLFSGRFDT